MFTPFPSVYFKSFLSTIISCPDIKIHLPSTGALFTGEGSGLPKATLCPLSKNSITLKLFFPTSMFNPNKLSKEGLGSVKLAVILNKL